MSGLLKGTRTMRWGSAVSDAPSFTEAVHQAGDQVIEQLNGEPPDLVFVFVSTHHAPSYYSVPEVLREQLGDCPVIGCSGGGVIGGSREVERRPGLALTGARLPGVQMRPFHLTQDDLPNPDAPPGEWEDRIGVGADDEPTFVILPDPFTTRADQLISGLDYAFPRSVKVGGLASGGIRGTPHALFANHRVRRQGVAGVALSGDLKAETIVAQGCRPVGRPMVVTQCQGNVIQKVGEEAPLSVLQRLFQTVDERDRRLIRRALHLGIVMDPLADSFTAGDFLIRDVVGLDEDTGALTVGDAAREGQVVQFHVRDAQTAREELAALLERYTAEHEGAWPEAALLFSCLGRGQRLFGEPDHDTRLFTGMVAPVPLAGFFCNGEIGPVGGTTFLHGYTSSFALFSRKSAAVSPQRGDVYGAL